MENNARDIEVLIMKARVAAAVSEIMEDQPFKRPQGRGAHRPSVHLVQMIKLKKSKGDDEWILS